MIEKAKSIEINLKENAINGIMDRKGRDSGDRSECKIFHKKQVERCWKDKDRRGETETEQLNEVGVNTEHFSTCLYLIGPRILPFFFGTYSKIVI